MSDPFFSSMIPPEILRPSPEQEAMRAQHEMAQRVAYEEADKREAYRQARGAALMYACQTAGGIHDHQIILGVARDFLAFLTGTEAVPLDS